MEGDAVNGLQPHGAHRRCRQVDRLPDCVGERRRRHRCGWHRRRHRRRCRHRRHSSNGNIGSDDGGSGSRCSGHQRACCPRRRRPSAVGVHEKGRGGRLARHPTMPLSVEHVGRGMVASGAGKSMEAARPPSARTGQAPAGRLPEPRRTASDGSPWALCDPQPAGPSSPNFPPSPPLASPAGAFGALPCCRLSRHAVQTRRRETEGAATGLFGPAPTQGGGHGRRGRRSAAVRGLPARGGGCVRTSQSIARAIARGATRP